MEVDVSGIAATDTKGITKSTWGKRDEGAWEKPLF